MVRDCQHVPISASLVLLLAIGCLPGCGIVPRSRMDECQKVSQLLRTENARLKDQLLSAQSQNRDYADRAVNDLRRLTVRDQAIERLEQSVHAYQDDRERLAAAYEQLRVSLGQPLEPDRASAASDSSQRVPRHWARDEAPDSEHPSRQGFAQQDAEQPNR